MIFLPETDWEVRDTPNKGQGVFTKKSIPKGTVIGDYIGIIVHPRDTIINENNFYLTYYHDSACISPILESPGVHLFNHSCKPNCWIYTYKGHTLFFTLREIRSGEELTISYLLPPKNEVCNLSCPHQCQCGSKICPGTMHQSEECFNKWSRLNNKQSKETKKAKIRYGKILPVLKNYPDRIPESYIQAVLKISCDPEYNELDK